MTGGKGKENEGNGGTVMRAVAIYHYTLRLLYRWAHHIVCPL